MAFGKGEMYHLGAWEVAVGRNKNGACLMSLSHKCLYLLGVRVGRSYGET